MRALIPMAAVRFIDGSRKVKVPCIRCGAVRPLGHAAKAGWYGQDHANPYGYGPGTAYFCRECAAAVAQAA